MKKIFLTAFVAFLLVPVITFAQFDPGGDPDGEVPLDGGVTLLVAGGIVYGIKKIRNKKNHSLHKED